MRSVRKQGSQNKCNEGLEVETNTMRDTQLNKQENITKGKMYIDPINKMKESRANKKPQNKCVYKIAR